jgi:hypothetical protein
MNMCLYNQVGNLAQLVVESIELANSIGIHGG